MLRAAARRTGRTFEPAVLARLAPGSELADPNRFVPDGIVDMASLEMLDVPADPTSGVDLAPIGVSGTLPATRLAAQRERVGRLATMATARVELAVRPAVDEAGLVTRAHLEAVAGLSGADGERTVDLLGALAGAASSQPRAAAWLVSVSEGAAATRSVAIDALDVSPEGTVSVRPRPGVPETVIGTFDPTLASTPDGLDRVLRELGPATIDRPGGPDFRVGRGPGGLLDIDSGAGRVPHDGEVVDDGGVGGETETPPATTAVPGTVVVPPLVSEAAAIGRFRDAFAALGDRLQLTVAPETRALVGFDLAPVAAALLQRTDPRRTVPARIATIVRIDGRDFRTARPGMSVAPTEDRLVVEPRFDVPSYRYLARYDRSRFCPGIDEIPPNSVTILETNPRFVEAFLVGLNHEMNRELLWRTFPTDQRATTFRRFWDRFDGQPDIGAIDAFGAGRLGSHLVDAEPKLVLLLRGELLRRYPTASVYAVRATTAGRLSTAPGDVAMPIFGGSFEPDIAFVGFDLADHELDDGNGWFFVIQEQPTEPRFGLDDPAAPATDDPAGWPQAAWSDTGLEPGAHILPSSIEAVGLGGLAHAGAVAAAFFQQPVRVAIHARHLVSGAS